MVKGTLYRKTDNYAFLLSGLLVLFLLLPLLRTFPDLAGNAVLKRIGMQTGFTTLMLLGIWSMHRETHVFRVGLALAVANVVLAFVKIEAVTSALLPALEARVLAWNYAERELSFVLERALDPSLVVRAYQALDWVEEVRATPSPASAQTEVRIRLRERANG